MAGEDHPGSPVTTCSGCGRLLDPDARFCGTCGLPTPPGTTGRHIVRRRMGSEARGVLLWQQLKPALLLWILLLATNGFFGLVLQLSDSTSPTLDLMMTVLDAVIICCFCYQARTSLAPLLRRFGFDERNWWMPLAALALFGAFMWLYTQLFLWLGAETVRISEDYQEHGWPPWSVFALVALCPGIFEELAFRGHIMRRLECVMKPSEALFVQAALFSVLHMSPLIFISHFLMGLVFGFLRQKSGSLYPGMLVHMAWNALVIYQEY